MTSLHVRLKHVQRGKSTVPSIVNKIGVYPGCVFPQRWCIQTTLALKACLLIALWLLFASTVDAGQCSACNHSACDCDTVLQPLCDMGCTSTDNLDLSSGSDTLPGVMSGCQCRECNTTRFANQFRDPRNGCEGYQPEWLGITRGLAFTRVTPSAGVLISDSTNPIRQINRDDLQFGWEPGIDVSIRRVKWNENSFELRFMGIETLAARASTAAGGTTEIHAILPVFVGDITSIDATYRSDLYGIEANWQFVTYCPFQYIAGLRYIGLNEQLTAELSSPTAPVTYRTNTQNDLYGVQVGITSIPDMPLLDCRWLTWSAKIGLYGNDAEQTSILTGAVGQRADSPADTAAFVGEFRVGLQTPLTQCITISAGYELLLMERVAIATDQLQVTNFFTGSGSDNDGNALFHGASAALTLHF